MLNKSKSGNGRKNLILAFLLAGIIISLSTNLFAQEKTKSNKDEKTMKRFVVERTFPNGLEIPINDEGKNACQNVVLTNSEEQVTWVHSYVSADKKKSFCIYDAPSAEAIKRVAKKNNLPVDNITEVSVLDPYFYK